MTEIEIANIGLSKLHNTMSLTSSDGTLTNATSTGTATTLAKLHFPRARQQILRLADWTCIQKRKQLASQNRETSTEYALGDLVIGVHTTIASVYKATVAGKSGAGAVTWPTSATVVDGEVTWTFQHDVSQDLPADNFSGYEYMSPIPTDYVRRVKVADEDGLFIEAELEANVLYCNDPNPILIYIPDEDDPTKWDPLLCEAIANKFASYMAYPLTGSHENEIALAQAAMKLSRKAVDMTGREKQHGRILPEPWMPGLFNYPPSSRKASDIE